MADHSYAIPRMRPPGYLAHSRDEPVEAHDGKFDVTSFVRRYQDVVVNTCNHFLRDMDESYDLAQQIFMAALSVSDRITTDTEWRAWLYRAAVNRSLNVLRSRKRRRWLRSLTIQHKDGIDPNNIAAPDKQRPDREFEVAELRRALEIAVDELPERQRGAFILHRHEGLTNNEIAIVMQLRVKAVDSLLHRALTNLRKRLLNHYNELRDR